MSAKSKREDTIQDFTQRILDAASLDPSIHGPLEDRLHWIIRDLVDEHDDEVERLKGERKDQVKRLEGERDEARQLVRELWASIPTTTKVAIFEKSQGWVPAWVRPTASKTDA